MHLCTSVLTLVYSLYGGNGLLQYRVGREGGKGEREWRQEVWQAVVLVFHQINLQIPKELSSSPVQSYATNVISVDCLVQATNTVVGD